MILPFINFRYVPRGVLKNEGVDLANVIEWKIMFEPYIDNNNLINFIHVLVEEKEYMYI